MLHFFDVFHSLVDVISGRSCRHNFVFVSFGLLYICQAAFQPILSVREVPLLRKHSDNISPMQIPVLLKMGSYINSLRPSDTYTSQYDKPSLVQIMACRLFGAKPLSEPMLPYCQLNPKEHISVKFYLKFKSFHLRKCTWKCRLPKWWPFCLGLNVLKMSYMLVSVSTMRRSSHDLVNHISLLDCSLRIPCNSHFDGLVQDCSISSTEDTAVLHSSITFVILSSVHRRLIFSVRIAQHGVEEFTSLYALACRYTAWHQG